jgi:hypothetical protein
MSKISLIKNNSPGNSIFDDNYNKNKISDNSSSKKYKSLKDLAKESREDEKVINDFRYDGYETGLRSTQQINIDYSKFENHTFFDSAVSKVNISFDKIVNEFPFESSYANLIEFKQNLTGFEKYVFNNFAKSLGYLKFSGSATNELNHTGQFLKIFDQAGKEYKDFSTRRDGAKILSPMNNPFTIQMFLNIPEQINDNQTIFQLSSNKDKGFALSLSQSNDTKKCDIIFNLTSGSNHSFVSASIDKGTFKHVTAKYSKHGSQLSGNDDGKLFLYFDSKLEASSSMKIDYEKFDMSYDVGYALIGSGSELETINCEYPTFLPRQTFSGSIDEFRYYHADISEEDIDLYRTKNIFAHDSSKLALYFRFNEPYGSYNLKNICLDHSGNSLHTEITNFTSEIRNTGSIPSPLTEELLENNPVLYPDFNKNLTLNLELLQSGSDYDLINPNLITKLVPIHYLLEGNHFENINNFTGSFGSSYKASNIPKSGQIGSGQLMMSFLFLWAKFFDEIKIYLDTLSKVINFGYDLADVGADKFLPFIGRYYGISLPGIFTNATQQQYNSNLGITDLRNISTLSLSNVQNQIWRRILTNLQTLRQGKGTISSVKGIIRTLGVEPDTIFDIREYGGPKAFFLDGRRKNITKTYKMLDFSGSLANVTETLDAQGFSFNKPRIVSSYLTSSRIEIGYPEILGTFVDKNIYPPHGISNNQNDGLLTSGSYSFEGIFQFPGDRSYPKLQSLFRLNTTGSNTTNNLVSNIVLKKADDNIKDDINEILFYHNSSTNTADIQPLHTLKIPSASFFDGSPWYVNLSFIRGDDPYSRIKIQSSSSFHLRCASLDRPNSFYTTSSLADKRFYGNSILGKDALTQYTTTLNSSGPFLLVGSQSINNDSSVNRRFLNNSDLSNDVRTTNFAGKVNFIRFWSKGTTDEEARERGRNIKSMGVDYPKSQYNHDKELTGSFNRLRTDAKIGIQILTASDNSGNITIYDYSQNNFNLSGSGFEPNKLVLKNEVLQHTILNPKFDIRSSDIKVRVRSFLNKENIEADPLSKAAPLYNLDDEFPPEDDNRFSIDLSVVKALDEDIMKMFSSFQSFDDALGDPRDVFEDSYIQLENLRKIYFKDLINNLNLSSYSEFFTWFDEAFTDLLEGFIPLRANFLGVNYVIESHVLERHRSRYFYDDQYTISRKSTRDNFGNI